MPQMASGPAQLDSKKRAAIMLMRLDDETASKVLAEFSDAEMEEIAVEIAKLPEITRAQIDDIEQDFETIIQTGNAVIRGDIDRARQILAMRYHDPALVDERLRKVKQRFDKKPFQDLEKVDAPTIAGVLAEEHPQTAALVLSFLDPNKVGPVLDAFDPKITPEIAMRIARMSGGTRSQEVVERVQSALQERFGAITSTTGDRDFDGRDLLAKSLSNVTKGDLDEAVLQRIREDAPELAEDIQARMFGFDDLNYLSEPDLITLMSAVQAELAPENIAHALKAASSEQLVEKIIATLPDDTRNTVLYELEGKIPKSQAVKWQQAVVRIARKLKEDNRIDIRRGGLDQADPLI